MKEFTYSYPTRVYFGEGTAAKSLEKELVHIGGTVMFAYGGGSIKKSGIYSELKNMLERAGKKVIDFSGIMPNPTYAKVQEGVALAKENHVDFILAAGGGSVIDCCKVISAQAVLEEDIWDMEYISGRFPQKGIPMGAIVTASGTGAEMNSGAVITYEEKMWKGPIVGMGLPLRSLILYIPLPFRRCRSSPALMTRSATLWKPISAIRMLTMFRTTWRLQS